jgi:hypothetical protein
MQLPFRSLQFNVKKCHLIDMVSIRKTVEQIFAFAAVAQLGGRPRAPTPLAPKRRGGAHPPPCRMKRMANVSIKGLRKPI